LEFGPTHFSKSHYQLAASLLGVWGVPNVAIGSTGREIRASQNGLTPGNDKIREGQRFTDQTIDLFFVRPHWQRSEETVDCPIAQIRYVRSCKLWQLYWIRNDGICLST
jgi:hypothetical protein